MRILIEGPAWSGMWTEIAEDSLRALGHETRIHFHNRRSLAVDARAPLRKGGDGGAVLVPGKPEQSRLLAILRHDVEGLEMPQGGPKLEPRVRSRTCAPRASGGISPPLA